MNRTELITGIQNGDREAFNDFCKEELPVLMSYARIFLPEEWADDVVQDVLFSFWKNRERLSEGTSARGYLMKSVYNRAMNYLRKENLSRQYKEWNDDRIAVLCLEGGDPERNPVIRNLFDKDLRKNLEDAINYEIERQEEVLEDGGHVIQETRTFDPARGITLSMRSKENAHDYRYMPEPDLPPIVTSEETIEKYRSELPELPDARRARLEERRYVFHFPDN